MLIGRLKSSRMRVLWIIAAIASGCGLVYLRYRRAKDYSLEEQHKANIETLFSGRK